jgi:hypothetical protein
MLESPTRRRHGPDHCDSAREHVEVALVVDSRDARPSTYAPDGFNRSVRFGQIAS